MYMIFSYQHCPQKMSTACSTHGAWQEKSNFDNDVKKGKGASLLMISFLLDGRRLQPGEELLRAVLG